jgi:phosphohistidine swiveling domain-containing protein
LEEAQERLKETLAINCEEKIRELHRETDQHLSESERLLTELGADESVRSLVAIAKELVYFRTYRTDYLACAYAWARPLVEEIARRVGCSYDEISALRVAEFEAWKNIDPETKARRDAWFAIVSMSSGQTVFSDRKEDEVAWRAQYILEEVLPEDLRGAVAYRGQVRGKVKKILSKKDIADVERGDIIVAPMTTPDMIPAMEKAAGFVTDEGGITCHAAIIAREMKKPCVIGTKFATKVLQDGDMIFLDAFVGVVTKV